MAQSINTISPKKSSSFVENEDVRQIIDRALVYLKAGYPVHLSGLTGTGKTTLAFRLASLIERPTVMMHGDESTQSQQLTGDENGFHSKRVFDNFISSVKKYEESHSKRWADSRLTKACKEGYTLIYDEYNRSKPETNNLFLSILEEKILELPFGSSKQGVIKVHPEFRCIFTSNPEEYAGTHATQEALLDRIITINIEGYSIETEVMIIHYKGGIDMKNAARLAWMIKEFRDKLESEDSVPTLRSGIMIAKASREAGIDMNRSNELFRQICKDILGNTRLNKKNITKDKLQDRYDLIDHLISKNFFNSNQISNAKEYKLH